MSSPSDSSSGSSPSGSSPSASSQLSNEEEPLRHRAEGPAWSGRRGLDNNDMWRADLDNGGSSSSGSRPRASGSSAQASLSRSASETQQQSHGVLEPDVGYFRARPQSRAQSTGATGAVVSRNSVDALQPAPSQPPPSSNRPPRFPETPAPPPVTLPRWQPDSDVTYCPICHVQFSFLVRKHHCRKCGRVVCSACSPHRITIPHQYIVRQPGTLRLLPAGSVSPYGEGGFADFSNVGGGERVRLCNPCVPDPNTSPPQTQGSVASSFSRSQSALNQPTTARMSPLSNRWSSYLGGDLSSDAATRSRSVTVGNQPFPFPTGDSSSRPIIPRHRLRSIHNPAPRHALADHGEASGSAPGRSTDRTLPPTPQPRRQIAEEDECPVCHRELPSRSLPDFEAQREAHITFCISSHSMATRTPASGTSVPSSGVSPPNNRFRRTGMFPYKATEKDCVDSAECTICLEEFEEGVDMARLECLCRFHRRCINAWFERHPGQCPIHQHGEYGT